MLAYALVVHLLILNVGRLHDMLERACLDQLTEGQLLPLYILISLSLTPAWHECMTPEGWHLTMSGTCTNFPIKNMCCAGVILCLERALASSGTAREDVDYVNAHATSTLAGDMAEYRAITK